MEPRGAALPRAGLREPRGPAEREVRAGAGAPGWGALSRSPGPWSRGHARVRDAGRCRSGSGGSATPSVRSDRNRDCEIQAILDKLGKHLVGEETAASCARGGWRWKFGVICAPEGADRAAQGVTVRGGGTGAARPKEPPVLGCVLYNHMKPAFGFFWLGWEGTGRGVTLRLRPVCPVTPRCHPSLPSDSVLSPRSAQ